MAHAALLLVLSALLLTGGGEVCAHEIPNDVRIQAYVRPLRNTLDVLIRVPLVAMTEVDYPRRGAGYVDLRNVDDALRQAASLWLVDNLDVREGAERLKDPRIAEVRVALPSDRSFATFDQARAHVTGPPLHSDLELVWNQQYLDVLLEFPIRSDRSAFAIHPRFERLGQRVVTALVFVPPAGASRAFELHGDPGLVRLDPGAFETAWRFVELGFLHILDGTDHLLFLLCVVIPFRRIAPLVVIVTAFTVAHSITLFASAWGYAPDALWFGPLIEVLIAASIVYMALENIVGTNVQRRWMITFAFGLVHGFGFAFALRETLQFAGDHLLAALLAFNVGVELGQLAVIVLLVLLLNLLFRAIPERVGGIVLSALVAHTAWHWLAERVDTLRQFPLPAFDAGFYAGAMRWTLGLVLLAVALWLANACIARTGWLDARTQSAADIRRPRIE